MLKAIAIDDEPIALEVIKNLSSKISFIELKAYFTDAFKAIDFLQKEKIDLLFLDIKMPDISGIDFLKALPDPPMVIFTTAYSEHAVQSFELDAIDYLLKPFSQSRFLKACTKAYGQHKLKNSNGNASSLPESIFIKSGYEQLRIMLDEILYVESSGNYMQFVLKDQKILSRLTMSETEELLPSSAFIRVHRSYIVSKKRIDKIEKTAVWVKQVCIPVGAGYAEKIDNLLK
jgi:two-component system, LytTR family, response regulator